MSVLTRMDPRRLALDRPLWTVALFALLWVLFGYGNVVVRKGAILEDALVNPEDPYRQMDEYARNELAAGFQGQGEAIPFLLFFPNGIETGNDLQRIREFTDRVRQQLGSAVLSLAVAPHYKDDGSEVTYAPYVPATLPADLDAERWKTEVRNDPGVYGVFVGRKFEWAAVVLFLPPQRDEVATFRRIAEFVEGRSISWWEWLYKTDIATPEGVGVGSHLVLHGVMDQGLNVDVFTLVAVGIVITLPVFILSFGAVRPALLSVLIVVLSGMLWTRGAIGLAQVLGFGLKERVYLLLAYANCIVQGVSFALHKYEAFHDVEGATDRRQQWQRAQQVDGLIGFTGVVAVLGFATLYSFQVFAIREFGIASAIGVVLVMFNACIVLPAIDLLTGGPAAFHSAGTTRIQKPLEALARIPSRLSPTQCLVGLTILAAIATALIWPGGYLAVWTRPLSFAKGTAVERTAAFLNQPGRTGFDALEVLVQPVDATGIRDAAFLERATAFLGRIRDDSRTRETASILHTVQRVSDESFHAPLPRDAAQTSAVFSLIDSALPRDVANKLYYNGGVRVSLYHALERSDEVGRFEDSILDLARREFPELRVSTYGEMALFPQWDRYIRIGKPVNVLSSQWIIVVLCMLKVWWSNRQRRNGEVLSPLWGGLITSAPLVFATAIMALLMMGLGIPLDAATAAMTALAINASIDFAIYFLDEYQHGLALGEGKNAAVVHAVRAKGKVILADTLLNALCFVPLLVSRFQPVAEMGWIMGVMLSACAVGTLIVMAALLPAGVRSLHEPGRVDFPYPRPASS